MKIKQHLFILFLFALSGIGIIHSQINTDQVMRIGQNALYFEDYMLSIQYFNQVIQAKPYLAQPYFLRAIAKYNLEDYRGAEEDATTAIKHNPFITDAYEVRGVARQNQGKLKEAIEDYESALKLLPENKGILFNKALAEEEIKDYASAEKSYEQLLSAHPNFHNGYIGRGKLRLSQGDTINALNDINKAIEINKNATNAYVLRADILSRTTKDFQSALDDMNEAIKLQPQQAGLFINRAYLRYNLDDYFGAMADYDYAIELDPLNSIALFNRGLLRAEVHDNDKAIADFSKVLSLNSNEYRAIYNRAILYKETKNYNLALEDINRIITQYPSFAGGYFVRYEIYRGKGDTKKAIADYDKSLALAKEPIITSDTSSTDSTLIPQSESQEVVANRFKSLLTIDNDTELEQEYNNSNIRGKVQDRNVNIEIEPLFTLSYYTSPTQLQENSYYIKEADEINNSRILRFILNITNHEPQLTDETDIRRHFESIEYYNSYISTHIPRAIDYFGRAMDFMTTHNYKNAIADLDKAIQLTPDFTLAYFLRSIAKYKNMEVDRISIPSTDDKNTEASIMLVNQKVKVAISEILADIDRVIQLSPRMAIAHYNKGNILVEMQDYTSAISAYTHAIELKPDLGEAYYNRGYVYLKLGNKEAGIRDLSKAGELGVVPSYSVLKRMTK